MQLIEMTHRTSRYRGGGRGLRLSGRVLEINEKQKDPGFGPQPGKKCLKLFGHCFEKTLS